MDTSGGGGAGGGAGATENGDGGSTGSRSASRSRGRSVSRSKSKSKSKSKSASRSMSGSRRGGRKASRSGSRGGSRSRSPEGVETMKLVGPDIAFVLGRGGATKRKIERVSGARLDMDSDGTLDIRGASSERALAKEYVTMVLQQRTGPVTVDFSTDRPDLSCVDVPKECVGFVTGRGGSVLRNLEEEWGTLMFFCQPAQASKDGDKYEKLAIFGHHAGRCGAELKVRSAVESKVPKSFHKSDVEHFNKGGFGVEFMTLGDNEFSYALGKRGSTRKKLARAAGCILEYVGRIAVVCGTKVERKRGVEYLSWLIQQRHGRAQVTDLEDRKDVTRLKVPSSVVGFITGHKGASLRQVEAQTGTFCFTDSERGDGKEFEYLLIFSGDRRAREAARDILKRRAKEKEDADRRGRDRYSRRSRSRSRGRGGGGGGGRRFRSRSRSRDRSFRRRSRSRSRGRDRDRGGRDRDRDHMYSRGGRRSRSRSRGRDRGGRRGGSRSRSPARRR